MHDEVNAYFDILSKCQCDFLKAYSAQHCLLYMIEKISRIRDSKEVFASFLTDLSKVVDCTSYELLLAKPHDEISFFDKISLTFMHAYLSQRQQKTLSELMSILFGVS